MYGSVSEVEGMSTALLFNLVAVLIGGQVVLCLWKDWVCLLLHSLTVVLNSLLDSTGDSESMTFQTMGKPSEVTSAQSTTRSSMTCSSQGEEPQVYNYSVFYMYSTTSIRSVDLQSNTTALSSMLSPMARVLL